MQSQMQKQAELQQQQMQQNNQIMMMQMMQSMKKNWTEIVSHRSGIYAKPNFINILLLCFSTCCIYYITICILLTINYCNIKLENHVYCVFDVFIESKLLGLVGPIQKSSNITKHPLN